MAVVVSWTRFYSDSWDYPGLQMEYRHREMSWSGSCYLYLNRRLEGVIYKVSLAGSAQWLATGSLSACPYIDTSYLSTNPFAACKWECCLFSLLVALYYTELGLLWPQECSYWQWGIQSRECCNLIGSDRFLLVSQKPGRSPQTACIFRTFPLPSFRVCTCIYGKYSLVHKTTCTITAF